MPQKKFQFIPAHSTEVQEKFINCLMVDGKKSVARRVFADMLQHISEKSESKKEPLEIFELAMQNVMPNVEVRPKRIGGSVYQIPREVPPKRKLTLAIRWVIQSCRKSSGKPMSQRLAQEILEAVESTGSAYRKKEEVHRMAQANKAFAHMANY